MIHIAEAGEAKGRVIVHSGSGSVSPVALEAAVWLARAFQSEIESLYVENVELVAMASHPVAREISYSGRVSRAVDLAAIEREFRFASEEFHQLLQSVAGAAEVRVRRRVLRDEAVNALTAVCADCGPWNAVALAEPFTSPNSPSLKALLEQVRDATGVLVVGPHASRTSGPVVIALEHGDVLTAMLSAAERITAVRETSIVVVVAGLDEADAADLEGGVRLVLAEWPNVQLSTTVVTRGSEAALAEAVRRLSPGLVMGQFGGLLLSDDGDPKPLAACLECPILIIR